MLELGWQAWVTLVVVAGMLVALVRNLAAPEAIVLGALGVLLVFGVLTPEAAFAGLSNAAVLTVGALFIISAAIDKNGGLRFLDGLMFPRRPTLRGARYRIMLLTSGVSAFVNNTPLVAMLMPPVQTWCAKHRFAASKLMMPLSYAAILGGMTTLLGTSTNLLVAGLMQEAGEKPLGMFTMTPVGLPAAAVGLLYFMWLGYRRLPARDGESVKQEEALKNLLFEVRVTAESRLAGVTIEEAGLRSLGEAYLVHLHRGGDIVPSAPERRILAGDVLSFVGSAAVLERLMLEPATSLRGAEGVKPLPVFEAIIAPGSSLVGRTLQEIGFRKTFDGVVLGIHRSDEQITGRLGRTLLRPGDLLIIEAPAGFEQRWQGHEDFFLVAPYRGAPAPIRKEKAAISILTLALIVIAAATELVPMVTAAFLGAGVIIATGCLTQKEARRAVKVRILALIAASLGIGKAVEVSGLAGALAGGLVEAGSAWGILGTVAAVYLATAVLTEVVTNNAAAALMLTIGLAAARQLGVPPEAFAVTVAVAASASFLSPIGYQTNLMVMSAGGYRFGDYLRAGSPVTLIVGVVTVAMVWVVYL